MSPPSSRFIIQAATEFVVDKTRAVINTRYLALGTQLAAATVKAVVYMVSPV